MNSEGHRGLTQDKTIPEHRDRWQSQLLVAVVGIFLVLSALPCIALAFTERHTRGGNCRTALGISVFFGLLVWILRAATVQAAIFGGTICLLITAYSHGSSPGLLHTGLPSLTILFLLTFAATRIARASGVRSELAEVQRGRRASQVIANLGWAGLTVSPFVPTLAGLFESLSGRYPPANVSVLLTAVLAEATADTVSSEIGQAWGGTPFLLGSWRRVEPGTDGAITITGTLAGIAGALIVVFISKATLQLSWKTTVIACIAAIAGLFFDTFLGATVERRGFLGNDLVNFASNGFSALLAAVLLLLCN